MTHTKPKKHRKMRNSGSTTYEIASSIDCRQTRGPPSSVIPRIAATAFTSASDTSGPSQNQRAIKQPKNKMVKNTIHHFFEFRDFRIGRGYHSWDCGNIVRFPTASKIDNAFNDLKISRINGQNHYALPLAWGKLPALSVSYYQISTKATTNPSCLVGTRAQTPVLYYSFKTPLGACTPKKLYKMWKVKILNQPPRCLRKGGPLNRIIEINRIVDWEAFQNFAQK